MVSCLQLPQISDIVKRYTYFRCQTVLCQRPIQYPSLEEERKSRRTQSPNKGDGGEEMKNALYTPKNENESNTNRTSGATQPRALREHRNHIPTKHSECQQEASV